LELPGTEFFVVVNLSLLGVGTDVIAPFGCFLVCADRLSAELALLEELGLGAATLR